MRAQLPVVGNLQGQLQRFRHAGENFPDHGGAVHKLHDLILFVHRTQFQKMGLAAAGGVAHRQLNGESAVRFGDQRSGQRHAFRLHAVGQRMLPQADVAAAHVFGGVHVRHGVDQIDGFQSLPAVLIGAVFGGGAERADGLRLVQFIGLRLRHQQISEGLVAVHRVKIVDDLIAGLHHLTVFVRLHAGCQLEETAVLGLDHQLAGIGAADAVKGLALTVHPLGLHGGAVGVIDKEVAADDEIHVPVLHAVGGDERAVPVQGAVHRDGDHLLRGLAFQIHAAHLHSGAVGPHHEEHGLALLHAAGGQNVVGAHAAHRLRFVVIPADAHLFLLPQGDAVAVLPGDHRLGDLVGIALGHKGAFGGLVGVQIPGQAGDAGGGGPLFIGFGAVKVRGDQRDVHPVSALLVGHHGIPHGVRAALRRLHDMDEAGVVQCLIHQPGVTAHRGDAEQVIGAVDADHLHLGIPLHIGQQGGAGAVRGSGQQGIGEIGIPGGAGLGDCL